MYSKEVMKHFQKPHNLGEMKNPDAIGKIGNPLCGDLMWIYLRIKNNRITDIKVKTFGCIAAIATSSMITDLAKGKTLEEAKKITNKDIADALKGLPPEKIHCSVLAATALKKAIENYECKKSVAKRTEKCKTCPAKTCPAKKGK
jgi:nitrogen fixation NifU-like protein